MVKKEVKDGYGNEAFRDVIDDPNKVTKKLRLRVIPTRIGINEVKSALIILKNFSDFLDKENFSYISRQHFR